MSQPKKKVSNSSIVIDAKQFNGLMNKLDALVKVTAASVFRGEKLKEGIVFLSEMGFSAKEVAKILGTTEHYVWNVNSEAKKQDRKTTVTEEHEEKAEENKAKEQARQ